MERRKQLPPSSDRKSAMTQSKTEHVPEKDKLATHKRTGFSVFYLVMIVSVIVLTIAVVIASILRIGRPRIPSSPPGAVHVNLLDYDVVSADYAQWRTNNSFVGFDPTNAIPPFFQVFHPSFVDVIGQDATIHEVVSDPGFAFAHEAPVYVPNLNVVFFSSNDGGPLSYNGWNNNSVVSMLNMTEVDNALVATASTTGVNIQVQTLNLADTVQMVNGGTGPYKGNLLLVTSGRALLPPSIVLVNPSPPFNATVLLDNFYGRQFNSLNDIKVLPGTDIMFFTDPAYGWMLGFRPLPMLPSQVYRFDPSTGQVRAVADGLVHPNGIAFTPDGRTAFVTDTGMLNGHFGNNQTYPATIYRYHVDPVTHAFKRRRVFAYSDSGIPDGIQLDTDGNLYVGCGDGTHVWNSNGVLIGKIFLDSTSANMVFTKSGLLILNEERVYLAKIQARGINLAAH